MASLLTAVGLTQSPLSTPMPNYGPGFLIFHFVFAYGVLSSRTLKQSYGIDHQVSPRQDLNRYGEAAVREGKITQKQLDMLYRNEGAHANSVENYTLFVASIALATYAGVPRTTINAAGWTYTVARILYAINYITVDHSRPAQWRGIFWWIGNLSCLTLLWKAGQALSN
ncbi:hypothetical protein BDV28DRAFT_147163 [Aspergillus coremiiformis]|uniref:Membrane-associated, eicosanoid/glutathione metabolism protein n=1 Tax=Aspergillus coremiiformis TaxID=138285 RepID=A0A5N6ZC49_9EURO|nr:hypothetical protein BDV28DRAFT_147163 [Aspergillus coremiiformis]